MSNTKNMHYLSQMITLNFLPKNGPHTFWMYDPSRGKLETRNIDKLFSRYKPWGQEFEVFLSGDEYENRIAPLLKELSRQPLKRQQVITKNGIEESEFNATVITDKEKHKILSKLMLQTVLLQRSGEKQEAEVEKRLAEIFSSNFELRLNLLLVEINPKHICPPLILTDGMPFIFLCPNKDKKSAGHAGFMFAISETRFLLWVSEREDCNYFCKKYWNINFLNLCRIEQHGKKCVIALAKTERNGMYLKSLIRQIPFFLSNEPIPILTEREWR